MKPSKVTVVCPSVTLVRTPRCQPLDGMKCHLARMAQHCTSRGTGLSRRVI